MRERQRELRFLPVASALLLVALTLQGPDAAANQSDPDSDDDGVYDVAEGPCGGDPLNASLRPERLDFAFRLADDDGDTFVDEALPPGSENYDCDGDGWKGSQEILIFMAATTANDQDPCGMNGWPADLAGSSSNRLNIEDLGSFLYPSRLLDDGHGTFNKFNHALDDWGEGGPSGGNPPDGVIDLAMARWNLLLPPHDPTTRIDIGDMNALNPAALASTSRPPMFGGQPAFVTDLDGPGPLGVGECPWPP